jgi:hypothetical protein
VPFWAILGVMSKETLVFIFGGVVFFTSFLGLPTEYKEWIFIVSGIVLMVVGYNLRRNAFLKSIQHTPDERKTDVFVESKVVSEEIPAHKDNITP